MARKVSVPHFGGVTHPGGGGKGASSRPHISGLSSHRLRLAGKSAFPPQPAAFGTPDQAGGGDPAFGPAPSAGMGGGPAGGGPMTGAAGGDLGE